MTDDSCDESKGYKWIEKSLLRVKSQVKKEKINIWLVRDTFKSYQQKILNVCIYIYGNWSNYMNIIKF